VNRNNSSVAIGCDSLAAINAVSAFKATTGLVADAMKAVKSLAIFNSVRLVWVPGHCGIEGNKRVDLLAKQASSSCFTGPEPSVGISTSTIRSSLSSQAITNCNLAPFQRYCRFPEKSDPTPTSLEFQGRSLCIRLLMLWL